MPSVVVFWVALAIGLIAFEIHHMAFYAMFWAVGAFAAALVASVEPGAIGLQALAAVGASTASTVLVRPIVRRAYDRRRHVGPVARGVHGGLVGHYGVTIDRVGDEARSGHIRLNGERWLAATVGEDLIEAGRSVLVVSITGTTLTVIAAEEIQTSATHLPGGSS